jgi:ribokinase
LPGPGETVEGDTFDLAQGGKGANQAVAVARLGKQVAFVTRVGKETRGEEMLAQLKREGVNTRHVVRDETEPTGAAVIHVSREGQKQILTAPGANRRLSTADVEAAAKTIRAAKVLLLQLEVPLEAVAAALRVARDAGVRTVLDPAPPVPLSDAVLQLVDVIRPNAAEAQVLTGIDVKNEESARLAAQQLLGRGVKAAAVDTGSGGNLLVWREGEAWLPHYSVESVDATGAGDAFAAALAVMLAENRPWLEAGQFASAAAALATTKLGAQAGLARREEVCEFLEQRGIMLSPDE